MEEIVFGDLVLHNSSGVIELLGGRLLVLGFWQLRVHSAFAQSVMFWAHS